jgi:type IV secretion system protein VirB6
MGFFATFSAWLNGLLSTYIGDNIARIAAILEPALLALASVYLVVWGYLHLLGRVDEPFATGLKKIITLVVILGGALHLWLYNDLIVNTFFDAPAQLAAGVVGAYEPVGIVDQIIFTGGDAAALLIQKGGLFNGDFSYYLAGFAVYSIIGLTAIYVMFLLGLSKIALSILLALGPLFIGLLFFETTKRFFESWIAQLANYAFVTILTVMVAALMLTLVVSASTQAAARGGGIEIADAVRVCMAAGLTFLVMRQVMPMASGLASGLALSSFGAMSAVLAWGFGRGVGGMSRRSGQFARGLLLDKESLRNDSLARKAGFALRPRRLPRENVIRRVGA